MNVECSVELAIEMEKTFRLDDNILRFILIRRRNRISDPSPLLAIREQEGIEDVEETTQEGQSPEKIEARATATEHTSEEVQERVEEKETGEQKAEVQDEQSTEDIEATASAEGQEVEEKREEEVQEKAAEAESDLPAEEVSSDKEKQTEQEDKIEAKR